MLWIRDTRQVLDHVYILLYTIIKRKLSSKVSIDICISDGEVI